MDSNNSAITVGSSENPSTQESKARKPTLLQKRSPAPARLDELDAQDRRILIQEFENAVAYFTEASFPVYLDGFGIIFPYTFTRNRVTTMRDKYILHTEKLLTLEFEKCNELVALHRERFQGIIELKDLSYRVYEKASPFLTRALTHQEVRRYVKAFIDSIRTQTIENGKHCSLKTLGEFYALHNRQGQTFSDWYAGADILIKTKFLKVLSSQSSRFLERPVFLSASEPFMALLGAPITIMNINLQSELKKLGWEISEKEASPSFSVSIFSSINPEKSNETTLTFISDGLRKIAAIKGGDDIAGNEFIIQCVIETPKVIGTNTFTSLSEKDLPSWPIRALVGAWILLQSAKDGCVSPGAGFHLGPKQLFETECSSLSTILTTSCKKIGGEQLAEDGAFEYLNLILINDEEAHAAATHGVELLLTILEHKKLCEIIKTGRSSIVSKTSLLDAH